MPTNAVVDAAGALALRREIYAQPSVTRADLARLLAIGRSAGTSAAPEFDALLAEVATDLLVHQADPPDYIAPADADWLIGRLGSGAGLACRAEYRMLVAVMSRAVSVPPALAAFAVREIERAITEGHRSAAPDADHAPGIVTGADVEALRAAVFAATDGSSLHVTRESAEALFRITHATADANNDPGFDDFFAKAVGNYLMGIAFHWTPRAADELEREHWRDEAAPGFGAFLSHMLGGDGAHRGHMFDALKSIDTLDDERAAMENAADAREMAEANAIDASEAAWVLAHLGRDGHLTTAERALLSFLKREATSMPPDFAAVVKQQAA